MLATCTSVPCLKANSFDYIFQQTTECSFFFWGVEIARKQKKGRTAPWLFNFLSQAAQTALSTFPPQSIWFLRNAPYDRHLYKPVWAKACKRTAHSNHLSCDMTFPPFYDSLSMDMPIYHNLMLTDTSIRHHAWTYQASRLYLLEILELDFFRDMAEQKIIA